jgi:hypothetical protein
VRYAAHRCGHHCDEIAWSSCAMTIALKLARNGSQCRRYRNLALSQVRGLKSFSVVTWARTESRSEVIAQGRGGAEAHC